MHSRSRDACRTGALRRQVELLEAIAEATGAAVDHKEQCRRCGEWFKSVKSHAEHCDGRDGGR